MSDSNDEIDTRKKSQNRIIKTIEKQKLYEEEKKLNKTKEDVEIEEKNDKNNLNKNKKELEERNKKIIPIKMRKI